MKKANWDLTAYCPDFWLGSWMFRQTKQASVDKELNDINQERLISTALQLCFCVQEFAVEPLQSQILTAVDFNRFNPVSVRDFYSGKVQSLQGLQEKAFSQSGKVLL